MKELIEAKIEGLKSELRQASLGEHYSVYDYLEGAIDAYEIVLNMLNDQDKEN